MPLDSMLDQISFLLQESAFTGRSLLTALREPMEALQSGRSPRALDLTKRLEPVQHWFKILDEVLTELKTSLQHLRKELTNTLQAAQNTADDLNWSTTLQEIEREWAFWLSFAERSQALIKKLQLVAEEEKLSGLGRAPLNDVWQDILAMAKN